MARIFVYDGREFPDPDPSLTPDQVRHTFATFYLRNGGDLLSLQRILGHESLEMVRVYAHLAEADVRAKHRRYSPMDRMDLRRSHGDVRGSSRAKRP